MWPKLFRKLEGMLLNGETDLGFFNLPIKSPDITQTDPVACFSVGEPCTTVDFVAAFRKNSYFNKMPSMRKQYHTFRKNQR